MMRCNWVDAGFPRRRRRPGGSDAWRMSMYLSNEDIGPTGWEPGEFLDAPFHPADLAAEAEPGHDQEASS